MDVGFIIDWIQTIITAHFLFGGVLGLMQILHPSFQERTAHLNLKYKRLSIFLASLLIGSFEIAIQFRKVMKMRELQRKRIWSLKCNGEVIGSEMNYKEAKATVDIYLKVKKLGGEEAEKIEVNFETTTITIYMEGEC